MLRPEVKCMLMEECAAEHVAMVDIAAMTKLLLVETHLIAIMLIEFSSTLFTTGKVAEWVKPYKAP